MDILRKTDVASDIAKFSPTEAWVRALGHKYIHDKGYLECILPDFDATRIDCIIVVHTPESTRFYIEYGAEHNSHEDYRYIEVPYNDFLSSLNNAPDEDVTNFWLGLH